jgi:hypothetical protein
MVNTALSRRSTPSTAIQRINQLIDHYLTFDHLNDRLAELPLQFANPKPRPWKTIDWHEIEASQIVDMELQVFLEILQGAIDTEAPIRDYTQTSRQYLQSLHPQLARFVGGMVADGTLTEIGLWEKEERQHTPALSKIYTQLTGEKPIPVPHDVRPYQSSEDSYTALYRHGVHRVATEYGATCLYLWLMAHTTGTLHTIFEELLFDEVNHMSKFWGFGVWAFPKASALTLVQTLLKSQKTYSKERSSLFGTLDRMTRVLGWQTWSWQNRTSFMWTCTRSLLHLWRWSRSLKQDDLNQLLGPNSLC